MNKRIQELADQAAEDVPGAHMNIPDEFCEKFAELIIKECVTTLEFHGYDDAVPYVRWMATNKLGVKESKGWVCPKCNADRTKIACPLGFGAQVDGRCPMTAEAQ